MPGPVVNECSPLGRVLSREMTRSEAVWNFGKRARCVWSKGWRGGRRWAGRAHPPFPRKRVSNLSSFSVNRHSKILIVGQLRGDWALPR